MHHKRLMMRAKSDGNSKFVLARCPVHSAQGRLHQVAAGTAPPALQRHCVVVTNDFCVAGAESSVVCDRMTTQQKTNAIQDILKNHEDNVTAMRAAKIGPGLEALVIEAMNNAMKDDLADIFAFKQVTAARRTD